MPGSTCAIVPTFNRASMLRECIDSLLTQTRPLDQIIIVNDGSTDNTPDVVKSYGGRVTCIHKENGGKSSALNLGLQQCTSDYVWICDDDDIALSDGNKILSTHLDMNTGIDFVFGTFCTFDNNTPERFYSAPVKWGRDTEPNIKVLILEENIMPQFASLVRRSAYSKTGPFREDLIRSQDYDMALRLCRQFQGHRINDIIFYQRLHSGIRGSAKNSFLANQNAKIWTTYDQKIFSQIRQEYKLDEFIPSFALTWEKQLAERAALLQRGCVFAKRGMWHYALEDFQQAVQISPAPATIKGLQLAEAILRTPEPWETLYNKPEWIAGLRSCYHKNQYGHDIIDALCRPLLWQARDKLKAGHIADAFRLLKVLVRVLGIRGSISRALSSLSR